MFSINGDKETDNAQVLDGNFAEIAIRDDAMLFSDLDAETKWRCR